MKFLFKGPSCLMTQVLSGRTDLRKAPGPPGSWHRTLGPSGPLAKDPDRYQHQEFPWFVRPQSSPRAPTLHMCFCSGRSSHVEAKRLAPKRPRRTVRLGGRHGLCCPWSGWWGPGRERGALITLVDPELGAGLLPTCVWVKRREISLRDSATSPGRPWSWPHLTPEPATLCPHHRDSSARTPGVTPGLPQLPEGPSWGPSQVLPPLCLHPLSPRRSQPLVTWPRLVEVTPPRWPGCGLPSKVPSPPTCGPRRQEDGESADGGCGMSRGHSETQTPSPQTQTAEAGGWLRRRGDW